jgi:hypothetical protein
VQNPYLIERLAADRQQELLEEARLRRLVRTGQSHRSVWARFVCPFRRSLSWSSQALSRRITVWRPRTATGAAALKAPAR